MTEIISYRYITNIRENAEEGSKLIFNGGFDRVEDLDKVKTLFQINLINIEERKIAIKVN